MFAHLYAIRMYVYLSFTCLQSTFQSYHSYNLFMELHSNLFHRLLIIYYCNARSYTMTTFFIGELGRLYTLGHGRELDYNLALKHLQKGAEALDRCLFLYLFVYLDAFPKVFESMFAAVKCSSSVRFSVLR